VSRRSKDKAEREIVEKRESLLGMGEGRGHMTPVA